MNCVATVTADPAIGAIADICVRAEKSSAYKRDFCTQSTAAANEPPAARRSRCMGIFRSRWRPRLRGKAPLRLPRHLP